MSKVRTYGSRYEVIERVGTGGMAEVYRARDSLLGREVALKVLNERLSHDRSFVERFRREARTAAGLNHPNIVALYDYGAENGTYFIVMEFIDGRTLADVIRSEGPLLPERAAEIAAEVARALGRAHAAGLVHRDVKPSNIMITRTGQTKVTDFGIARMAAGNEDATVTQTGMVIGTAAYLSPEQAQGRRVDARSDVYSLGCVLYEMLTGRPPFEGDTPLSVAYKHVRENPEPPSSLNPDVPPALDAVVMKAMSKNPDNRYADASDMAEDLDRFLSGQRVTATPLLEDETTAMPAGGTRVLTPAETWEESRRRRTWPVALLVLLALAALGALAWFAATNLLGADVRVPRVVGMTEDQARAALERRNFEVEVERGNSRRPEGRVFRQDPEPGELAPEGSTVTIFVSTGPGEVEVPPLIGLTVQAARDALAALDLELRVVDRQPSNDYDKGEIIDQNPSEGTTVEVGSTVEVVVASGPETVTVPNLIGLSEDEAVSQLESAGLAADVVREPSEEDEGIVIDQDPDANEEVEPGSTVRVVVSSGPEEQPLPDVRGMDADDAEAQLEQEYGLVVTQEDNPPTEECAQPPGTVCDTDPPPGTPVSPGDEVVLYVQPGP